MFGKERRGQSAGFAMGEGKLRSGTTVCGRQFLTDSQRCQRSREKESRGTPKWTGCGKGALKV